MNYVRCWLLLVHRRKYFFLIWGTTFEDFYGRYRLVCYLSNRIIKSQIKGESITTPRAQMLSILKVVQFVKIDNQKR
jgi:hypothetical protein